MHVDDASPSCLRSVVVDLVAGSLGATSCVYVGQPLDTLKVKMQTFPNMYPTLSVCFRETLNREGIIRGLYAGTVPSLAANVAENSVLFAAYGLCQSAVASVSNTEVTSLSTVQNGTAGFLAAFFSSFTLCPTELVKCRMQSMRETGTANPENSSASSIVRHMFRHEGGIRALFRGLSPTMMREMPGYFFFFSAYEWTREALRTPDCSSKNDIGVWRTIVAGGVAGMTLWTIIFPFDVAKSRMQVSFTTERETMVQCISSIVRRHGILALYNGLLPTLIRTFPATGALFLTYEYSKEFILSCV